MQTGPVIWGLGDSTVPALLYLGRGCFRARKVVNRAKVRLWGKERELTDRTATAACLLHPAPFSRNYYQPHFLILPLQTATTVHSTCLQERCE